MTLVYGLCRHGEGVLIADTATVVPLTNQKQHPFREPTLKVLSIGEAVLGYAGNAHFLAGLLEGAPENFDAFLEATLECHLRSEGEIEFVALRHNGQEMHLIREGCVRKSERCYLGSPSAYRSLGRLLPASQSSSFLEEMTAAKLAFRQILDSQTDGVAGLSISCTVGGAKLGYETSLYHVAGPVVLQAPVNQEGAWQPLPLTDKYGGQFTVILTGLGYAGLCIAYPQAGTGFLFVANDPEPILKIEVPQIMHRDLSRYDIARLADTLDGHAIQIGIPDSYDVAKTMAVFLREEIQRAGSALH